MTRFIAPGQSDTTLKCWNDLVAIPNSYPPEMMNSARLSDDNLLVSGDGVYEQPSLILGQPGDKRAIWRNLRVDHISQLANFLRCTAGNINANQPQRQWPNRLVTR